MALGSAEMGGHQEGAPVRSSDAREERGQREVRAAPRPHGTGLDHDGLAQSMDRSQPKAPCAVWGCTRPSQGWQGKDGLLRLCAA